MKTKQVIVVRKDLNMPVGKVCAQSAHASMKAVIQDIPDNFDNFSDETKEAITEWLEKEFTKVVVGIDSEDQMLDLYNKAKYLNIPCALITDNGKTIFNGVLTNTCIAIGPDVSSKIDKLTGDLKLL